MLGQVFRLAIVVRPRLTFCLCPFALVLLQRMLIISIMHFLQLGFYGHKARLRGATKPTKVSAELILNYAVM